jgi:translation elongation factor P/translation initiation factor 5A
MIRNTYLEFIKTDSRLSSFDFLVVLDMDEVNSYQIDSNNFSDALNFLSDSASRAAVFANQRGGYYDL